MSDDPLAELATSVGELAKLMAAISDVQLQILRRVARLEANVLTQRVLAQRVLEKHGVPAADVEKFAEQLQQRLERVAQDRLSDWLAAKGIAEPPPGDSWWDRPGSK